MSDVRAPVRRRLTDLYIKGRLLALADDNPDEDPIEVWISKISPLQKREAADHANVKRVAVLALKDAPPSDPGRIQYFENLDSSMLSTRELKVSFLIAPELNKVEMALEAEVGARERWATDDYLLSLQRAWNEGMEEKYLKDPDDEEAARVFNALSEYTEEVNSLLQKAREELEVKYKGSHESTLNEKCVDRLIEIDGEFSWYEEFRRWQLYFAVRRVDDHKELYFEDKAEVDELDSRVFDEIYKAFDDLNVSLIEGKD